ncbi:hypothetical protein ACXET9_15875 [Brachybacterium sp. DNPG3]
MTASRRRLRKRIGIMLCAVLLVAVLIWAVALAQVTLVLPYAAKRDAEAGLSAGMKELERLAGEDAAALDATFGAPIGAERTLRCTIDRIDSGWFTTDHRQRCELLEIEYRRVPAEPADAPLTTEESAARLLGATGAWSDESAGTPGEKLDDQGACRQVLGATADLRRAGPRGGGMPIEHPEARLHAVVLTDPRSAVDCAAPFRGGRPPVDERTITDDRMHAPDDLDSLAGIPLLVVARSVRVSSSSLGCLPLPVFCEPPTTHVRMPASF